MPQKHKKTGENSYFGGIDISICVPSTHLKYLNWVINKLMSLAIAMGPTLGLHTQGVVSQVWYKV